MNSFRRLITPCRLVLSVKRHYLFTNVPVELCCSYSTRSFLYKLHIFGASSMSQKSITSFFKMTPRKATEIREENHVEAKSPSEQSQNRASENSPAADNEVQTSKRQRLESSSSEQEFPKSTKRKSSPLGSETKRKSKRLRIESSSSEEGGTGQNEEQEEKKGEHFTNPKTDDTAKNKHKAKKKKSPLGENRDKDLRKTNHNKNSKVNCLAKSEIKKESENAEQTEDVKKSQESLSPQKAEIKEDKTTPETKRGPKNVMSFFIKKEVNGSEGEGKGSGVVTEEDYNPAKAKYHSTLDACWAKGQPVPYLALARTLEAIEQTSSRLKIVETLANYFRSVMELTPEDLLPSVYMCLNQLAPAYHSLELGIAETYLMKAIGQCTGQSLAQVKAAAQKAGDLGQVAQSARAKQRTMMAPAKLTCRKVFAALKEIAHMTGAASVSKKIGRIQSLYVACRGSEARYLVRSLEGKLRIGLAEQSVLQALAQAAAHRDGLSADQLKARVDEQALLIKTTYCECPNYDLIIPALLQHGAEALPQHCRLTPGIPLKPMLAHPTKGIHEVFNRFENEQFTCEWKYDGERAQIHVPSSTDCASPDFANARVFSRNQEDNTSKYPDVLRRLPGLLKDSVTSCVLDTEAVAYDVSNKQILPFQILSTRKRKDADEAEIKVQVCVFAFDLLYLNGKPLVKLPLADRRELLRTHFNEVEGEWQFAAGADCSTLEEVQALLDESIKKSCEGLMVKTLHGQNAKYDIARRSHNWLKLKKDYLEGVGDTIDAAVLGGYRGRGKRAGAFGGFLLACYDPDAEEFQTLCKIGTGFSDDDLQTLTKALEERVIDGPKSYYRFDAAHAPDAWFSAGAVWEVRCADLSLSPAHRAALGLVDRDKGISLRFPRFVRVRDDKTPEQATSARQIADMYLSQDQVKNQAAKPAAQDDFY